MNESDALESQHIKFEWTIRGLGELFEASKGEGKSKVTKSPKFGQGRWQVLFYANSGNVSPEGYGYVSLYLSCEPTVEELEKSVGGPEKWTRDGVYKFSFDLRNSQKTILFQTKEANNHSFSYKTVNWGWAQYARRDFVYYNASTVRTADAFVITCTISSQPAAPLPAPAIPQQLVPRDLLSSIGDLLDDPIYSDVEFTLPKRRGSARQRRPKPRVIYAARKILQRVDYFDTMFHAGFAEGSSNVIDVVARATADDASSITHIDTDATDVEGEEDEHDHKLQKFEDSDDEDDYNDWGVDLSDMEDDEVEPNVPAGQNSPRPALEDDTPQQEPVPTEPAENNQDELEIMKKDHEDEDENEDGDRNVRRKLSHPSSPRTVPPPLPPIQGQDYAPTLVSLPPQVRPEPRPVPRPVPKSIPGPSKVRVIIKDAPYVTYLAVLYYIYTDTIVFAPLASSFTTYSSSSAMSRLSLTATAGPAEKDDGAYPSKGVSSGPVGPTSRRAWILEWQSKNPGRPRPCSAKAVYRLADRLDLPELKERAFQHIIKSLSVENVAYEVFSDFSAAFEDVRKVEMEFFLEHWSKIRGSDTMRNVWQQIRLGRHPGFEEVWPLIAENLEFKPKDLHPEESQKP